MLLTVVYYYGEVDIDLWEWLLSAFYVIALYIYFARRKNMRIKKAPEYRFFLWALMAKLFGGVVFSLIYFYHYEGGDTISFYYSGLAMGNLAFTHPIHYLQQLMGDNSLGSWLAYPSNQPRPLRYVYFDDRSFVVIRVVSLLTLITFKSYLITTLVMSSLSFFGIWAGYRTFVRYYPKLDGKFAIGFLFLPSVVFWSSSIMKDTITFSALCWLIHGVDELYFRRNGKVINSITILLSSVALIAVKPYIFMVILPALLLWLFYKRIAGLRNNLIKFVAVPFMLIGLIGLSFFILVQLGDELDKFSLDQALETVQITQKDMLNEEAYGGNSFNIGKVDGTLLNALSKFPIAVNAAMFRPYLWEANNGMMVISGLENLWILGLTLFSILRAGPVFFIKCTTRIPLVLMSLVFAVLFAFTVGLTTPNFGALVRFRIPMMPFMLSALYIIVYMADLKRTYRRKGKRFEIMDQVNERNIPLTR